MGAAACSNTSAVIWSRRPDRPAICPRNWEMLSAGGSPVSVAMVLAFSGSRENSIMTIGSFVELCKVRIGVMVALSAVMGYCAIAPSVSVAEISALVIAMMLGSAAASVFNHWYDRDIDRLMTRTQARPLARGALERPGSVLVMAAGLLIAGLALAVWRLNWVVALHLWLGVFVYAIVYTMWLKRRTRWNIVIGGAAGSFAVLAGAAVVCEQPLLLPLLLSVVLFLWTPSHFWALAIVLREDYRAAHLPMLPVLVGDGTTARVIFGNSLVMVAVAALPWVMGLLGSTYGICSTVIGLALLWCNWQLIRTPTRKWALRNFLASMQYLAALFVAVLTDGLW